MATKSDDAAIAAGKIQAQAILEFRSAAKLNRRTAVTDALNNGPDQIPFAYRAERQDGSPLPGDRTFNLSFLDKATKGVLIAEGDSWFDYPFHDVLRYLEDEHGYDVESVAHKGDAIEEMAFGGGQLEEFTRRIESVMRRGATPKAILLSGGGNDVSGDQFVMLLNHKQSGMDALNEDVVRGVIDQRVRNSYVAILSAVTALCTKMMGHAIPIFMHGYDYAIPDGRGYLGGFGPLPGPWLEPSFRRKGYDNLKENSDIIARLIDRLNEMLANICTMSEFNHVKYIDIRKTLSSVLNKNQYRDSWANELHPTKEGFKLVADKFAQAFMESKFTP